MPPLPQGRILHQWTFAEFDHHAHSLGWKIVMTIVLVAGISWSLWQGNVTLAFFLLAFGVVLIAREMQGPEIMRVYIRDGGLELILDDHHRLGRPATTSIPWKDIQQFWILYQPPDVKNIYIRFTSPFRSRLRIPLGDQNPVEIRNTLNRFLEEDLSITDESFTDMLARRMKL